MPDVVDAKTRSRMMSGIRGENTKPEIQVRKALHAKGFRYRLHVRDLPGRPDLVLPKYCAVIFVNGCFWHGHDCHLFKLPTTRAEFWKDKIEGNRSRDAKVQSKLKNLSWRVLTIWECALKGRTRIELDEVVSRVENWLVTEKQSSEICGKSSALS